MQTSCSNDILMKLAKENYAKLTNFCNILDQEGYWEQPKDILNKSILDILDMYVQSVLINLAVFCGRFYYDEREFIIDIPTGNIVGCTLEGELDEKFFQNAKRVVNTPPIILQLCGVRDVDKKSDITIQFFDSLLNILLCMSDLNSAKDMFVTSFVQEYYKKISVFINQNITKEYITPRYIFRKLSSDHINGDLKPFIQCKEEKDKLEQAKEQLVEMQMNQIEEELKERTGKVVLEDLLHELDELVGLSGVKDEISSLINLIKVRKLRESYQMPTIDMTYHMVFTGNPGTGKTTVARLVAKIYKELGLLSKGVLVETDRAGLVAGYVGQTALKVKEVVERAIGGVLFIDEAYSLSNNTVANDFGGEAIDTLVKMMEDHRDNLVVIVAGYNAEMNDFLKANTGLISRFNKFIDFPDYSFVELMQILDRLAENSGFLIEEDAKEMIEFNIINMNDDKYKAFGNARGIRNVFEKLVVNQANRIVTYKEPTKEELKMITKKDTYNIL